MRLAGTWSAAGTGTGAALKPLAALARTSTEGGPGVVVVNRGLEHTLVSKAGVSFIEALAPVPLDHVPDRSLDLVLGPDGGTSHVET